MPEFPAARGNLKTDVLIVGGGIAGLLTAYELQKSGVSCIVAERRRLCGGVTGKTTAKITFQHGLIYGRLLREYGAEKAKMYLEANKNALKKYAELTRGIDCGFVKTDSFIYSRNNRAALEDELAALEKIGFSARFCGNLKLPFSTVGAVEFPNQAEFNPLKFLRGITEVFSENARIFENTHVIEINGKTALTKSARISAEKIVIAAHFPFMNRYGCYFLKMYQSRSSVAALENAPKFNGYYMDENTNGFSFRNCEDLLLVGGGAHKTGEPCRMEMVAELCGKAFPRAKARYFWNAQDCITLDGIPYIGNYSAFTPNIFVATGFNKWGMTSAMAAAEIIRDKILEKPNEYAEVFDPQRSIWRKQLWVNGFNSAKNLLTPTLPRCPHMGCALKWNSAEKSWDCPCHGSRFAEDGRLLDNPANQGRE